MSLAVDILKATFFRSSVDLTNAHKKIVGRFSIEVRETKTKVITLANHNQRKQRSEPIKTRSKYMHVTGVKRGKTRASKSGLVLA